MVIGVDANEANAENRVGTGQYTYNLLREWSKRPSHDFHLYLRNNPEPDLPSDTASWQYHRVGPSKLWLTLSLPLHFYLHRPKLDVFFAPAHYAAPYLPYPLVVAIHDLAYEYYPDLFLAEDLYKLKQWTRSSVQRATKVIAVSQATKDDIVRLYGVDPGKIEVVHNGYDQHQFSPSVVVTPDFLSKHQLPGSYILFTGTIQPRKNILRLVEAFRLLKKSKAYSGGLVIAGKHGWMSHPIVEEIQAGEYTKDIRLLGYVSQDEIPMFYKGAEVFALPSLYEGFGVPVLEAMACGTPVVTSNVSSLPEVAGEAGVLCDPKDPRDIAIALKTALDKRGHYIQKGLARAQEFSWEKTAQETLRIVEYAGRKDMK